MKATIANVILYTCVEMILSSYSDLSCTRTCTVYTQSTSTSTYCSSYHTRSKRITFNHLNHVYLDGLAKDVVESSNLGGDRDVNGSLGNLNNETAENVGVDLEVELELALADERRAGNSGLDSVNGLLVELGGRGDGGLNQTLGCVDKSLELLNDAGNESQSVVVGDDGQEVGQGLVSANGLGQNVDDGLLVLGREGGVRDNLGNLGLGGEHLLQLGERALGLGQVRLLGGGGVLS